MAPLHDSDEPDTDLRSGQDGAIGGDSDSLQSISLGSKDDEVDVESVFTPPAAGGVRGWFMRPTGFQHGPARGL